MSPHSNGVLAALNMIQHWEYTMDLGFLREVAFPFASGVLEFYACWMTRRVRKSICCFSPRICSRALMEYPDGVGAPHQCSLGTAACYRLFMLTCALYW